MVGALLLVTAWPSVLVLIGSLGVVHAAALFVALGAYETDQSDEPDEDVDVWTADRRLYVYPILAIFLFFAIRMVAAGGVNISTSEFITSVYGFTVTVLGFEVTAASVANFHYSALLVTAGATQLVTGRSVDRYDHRKVLLAFLGTATLVLAPLATTILSPPLLFITLGCSAGVCGDSRIGRGIEWRRREVPYVRDGARGCSVRTVAVAPALSR